MSDRNGTADRGDWVMCALARRQIARDAGGDGAMMHPMPGGVNA